MGIIITGLSGSGKSTALHALEDVGCFCTDNLPLPLLTAWAGQVQKLGRRMAVCVDIRSALPADLHRELEGLRKADPGWRLIFLDADDSALQRRFSTVRRRHPFAPNEELSEAIRLERNSMQELHDSADLVINTSAMNPYELADQVEAFWRREQMAHASPGSSTLTLTLMSFSYRFGLPADADMVVDMRFLPNPHYEPGMAVLTGRDTPVVSFLESSSEVDAAADRLSDWLAFIWPQMRTERKRYFTLAFGCSGGRHRSVYMAERIAGFARDTLGVEPLVRHRELPTGQQTTQKERAP